MAAVAVACLLALAGIAHADEVPAGARVSGSFLGSDSFSFASGILVNRNADPELTYAGSVLNRTALAAVSVFEFQLVHDKKSSVAPQEVPEPGTLALVGTAVLGVAGLLRRRFA